MNLKKIKIKRINQFRDKRGLLSVFSSKQYNFKIKRVYLIENTNIKAIRGKHSRKLGKKIYFCTEGSVQISAEYKRDKIKIKLKKGEIVELDSRIWIEIKFDSKKTRCLVFDNREYDEKEYVRRKTDEKKSTSF